MTGKPIALDTNGWLALLNRDDRLHAEAVSIYRSLIQANAPLFLTDWVVAETGNGLARSRMRSNFSSAATLLINDPRLTLVVIDEQRMQQALDRYDQRKDKNWGLVDCSTMLVMEEFGLTEVFTSDDHFTQAGFETLLSRN